MTFVETIKERLKIESLLEELQKEKEQLQAKEIKLTAALVENTKELNTYVGANIPRRAVLVDSNIYVYSRDGLIILPNEPT